MLDRIPWQRSLATKGRTIGGEALRSGIAKDPASGCPYATREFVAPLRIHLPQRDEDIPCGNLVDGIPARLGSGLIASK